MRGDLTIVDLVRHAVLVLVAAALPGAEALPGPAAAAAAPVPDSAGRVHALLVQAQAGSMGAAASLLRQGLFAELALIDPQHPAVAAWSVPQADGDLSGQQLYGVVLESWANANPSRLRSWSQATALRARTFLSAHYTEDPLILLSSALSFNVHEPTDRERARELFLQALLMEEDGAADAPERLAVTRLAAQVAVACGYPEQEALLRRLTAQTAAVHDPYWQVRSAWVQAQAERASLDPGGMAMAALREAQAAAWAEQAHDPFGQALSLVAQAGCETATEHGAAAQDRAAALEDRAAALFGQARLPENSALALRDEALCLRPDRVGAGGSWQRATELLITAAAQFAAADDLPDQADALSDAARCAAQNDPTRSTMASRQLLREAEHAYRQLHDDGKADALLEWFNPSLDAN